ncbi:MAG: ATP phosphoribosyltransferase [Arenicella sp.]
MIRIALSKGRILKQTLPLLEQIDLVPLEDPNESRKLILPTNRDDVEFVILRATDVPTYVQFGSADLGVVGKDGLMEHGGEGVAELLDLQIARCRIMVAGHENEQPLSNQRRLRVATKYVNIAEHYYASKGEQVELVKLYGSMELAPLVGLADKIVDLVETGNTLRANNLVEQEHIADISCRLIANVASLRVQHEAIATINQQLSAVVAA